MQKHGMHDLAVKNMIRVEDNCPEAIHCRQIRLQRLATDSCCIYTTDVQHQPQATSFELSRSQSSQVPVNTALILAFCAWKAIVHAYMTH